MNVAWKFDVEREKTEKDQIQQKNDSLFVFIDGIISVCD